MNKYETMFVLKSELSETERKDLFNQLSDAITKNQGEVLQAQVWAEKRKLAYPIKKHAEGMYYLIKFNIPAQKITELNRLYRLNENILRFMFIKQER